MTFWLPFGTDEQLKVLRELSQISFLGYKDRVKLEQIERDLLWNRFLTNEESDYLEKIIQRYGYAISIT